MKLTSKIVTAVSDCKDQTAARVWSVQGHRRCFRSGVWRGACSFQCFFCFQFHRVIAVLNCEHRVPQFECPGASEREHLTQTTWFLTHAVVCPFTLQWPHWPSCTHPRGELQNISMILLPVTPAQCRAYRQSRVHADEHPLSADGQLLEGQGKGLSCAITHTELSLDHTVAHPADSQPCSISCCPLCPFASPCWCLRLWN